MPRKQGSEPKLSLSKNRDELSALSSQIVRVPRRLPVRPDHALPMQSDDQFVLYRCAGTPYGIARDRGRSCEEIAFAELQTGGIVEIVRDPRDAQHTQLAVWSNDEVELVDFFRTGDRILIPPRRHDHIVRNLVLPSGVAPYKSLRDLAHEIRRAICSCVRVPNPYPSLLAAWVVYTWVADRLAIAVHLCICGLPESGKTTLLELLRLFCRRSLLITDISAGGFYEACSLVSPTLMIDEAELDQRSSSQPVRRLLRAATNRDHSIMRKGSSYDVFGPKIICAENPPDDPALLSRCLVVRMVEEDTSGLQKPRDHELVALSQELQKQLLHFRLKNYKTIHAPQVPGAERLHPRLRDLVTTVAAAFRDDP